MIYGDFLKTNKVDPDIVEDIDIIIYTEAKLTCPIHFINEVKSSNNNEFEIARFNISVNMKKVNCTLHIRNKYGASKQNSESQHGPSIKMIQKGLTPEKGVPILIETGEVLEKNVDPKVVKTIKKKYTDIIEFTKGNKEELNTIWNTKKVEDVKNAILDIINDDKNKKYNLKLSGNN